MACRRRGEDDTLVFACVLQMLCAVQTERAPRSCVACLESKNFAFQVVSLDLHELTLEASLGSLDATLRRYNECQAYEHAARRSEQRSPHMHCARGNLVDPNRSEDLTFRWCAGAHEYAVPCSRAARRRESPHRQQVCRLVTHQVHDAAR